MSWYGDGNVVVECMEPNDQPPLFARDIEAVARTSAPTPDALTAETSGGIAEVLAAHDGCGVVNPDDGESPIRWTCGVEVPRPAEDGQPRSWPALHRTHLASAISAAGWGSVAEVEAERDEWKSRRDAAVADCRHLHQDGKTREQWHLDNCGAMRALRDLQVDREAHPGASG